MPALTWDTAADKLYETGISQMALYQLSNGAYTNGVAWNGVTAFTESPSGAEATAVYADNIKYLNLMSIEEFGATLECIQYPPEFNQNLGVWSSASYPGITVSQQGHKTFGLAYKTKIGKDDVGNDFGYKIHLVYGCLAAPTEKAYATVNDSPENMTFSFTLTTTPVKVTGYKDIAHLEIDSRAFTSTSAKAKLAAFEKTLFGDTAVTPSLPLPDAVKTALTV